MLYALSRASRRHAGFLPQHLPALWLLHFPHQFVRIPDSQIQATAPGRTALSPGIPHSPCHPGRGPVVGAQAGTAYRLSTWFGLISPSRQCQWGGAIPSLLWYRVCFLACLAEHQLPSVSIRLSPSCHRRFHAMNTAFEQTLRVHSPAVTWVKSSSSRIIGRAMFQFGESALRHAVVWSYCCWL